MLSHPKITPDHLAKHALVYVRQSTPKQVLHNQESQHDLEGYCSTRNDRGR